ncbi:MAG: peptidylprolyl isomerase [Bacteroidales bacterium]|nr:peptidylprolyl isomerase [Bacteroidales bacterium]
MRQILFACLAAISLSLPSCQGKQESGSNENTKLLIETDLGNMKAMLYDDTPLHRDNIIKLVKKGYYDGQLFHRVIKDFMIQTGDPQSKDAKEGARLGDGGPGYTIPAEIVFPTHFHKKGALCAARQGDDVNPKKSSSGSQFYIVSGTMQNDYTLDVLVMTRMKQKHEEVFGQYVRANKDQFVKLSVANDTTAIKALQDSLINLTEKELDKYPFEITPEQKQAYCSVGGSPHLDGNYTVFGEIMEGLDVVDKIQQAETSEFDRPVKDIRIIKISILK